MERDEALQSLLVQLSKLQVVLRRVTAERDTLKTELAEQASSQQQCLQLLLEARQQLQIFQVDICRVRDNNEQLAAHNLRLQQQVQQLQNHTQQQQQQLDGKQRTFQQQCEQQERPDQHAEERSRMALLSHLAATWHNQTDLAHGDSTISSSSSKRTSPTGSTSASTDTSDIDPLCGSRSLQETQAAGGDSTTIKKNMDQLCSLLHGQQLQQKQQHQLQQPFLEAEPNHTHEDAVYDIGLQQHHSSCSLSRLAEGLPVVKPAHVCAPVQQASTAQLVLQPLELTTAVSTMQQQPAEASAAAAVTASDGVVHLTQQQLDYIMAEVEQLQQKLAQTTAKLDAVVVQPITSQLLLQQEAAPQQGHHPHQQGSCASSQIRDLPISEWHQQLKHKQQQLQHRQQQVLGPQQSTQQQQQQRQQLQRFNQKHRQCVDANCQRLHQQQQQQRQQQQQLCELPTPQEHPSKPSWNYQNPQVQKEQRQRRQLQRDAIRLRAQVQTHLHQDHTAAASQCTENRPLPPQQQQQRQRRQGQQAELQHCTHQQQHKRDPQNSDWSVTAAATTGNINTETLETSTNAAVAAAASSCLQLEGRWVSSASSSGQPAAAASAGEGPATVALNSVQPSGRQTAASPAETVVFMRPICIRGPGVLHKLHG